MPELGQDKEAGCVYWSDERMNKVAVSVSKMRGWLNVTRVSRRCTWFLKMEGRVTPPINDEITSSRWWRSLA